MTEIVAFQCKHCHMIYAEPEDCEACEAFHDASLSCESAYDYKKPFGKDGFPERLVLKDGNTGVKACYRREE